MTLRGQRSKFLTGNISKTVTGRTLDPWEHLHLGPTGSRLAPSDLTLDDLEGSKIKVLLFEVKNAKNGNSHDVGPNGDYTVCPWASLWMTLRGYGDRHVGIYASLDNWRTCLDFCYTVLRLQDHDESRIQWRHLAKCLCK